MAPIAQPGRAYIDTFADAGDWQRALASKFGRDAGELFGHQTADPSSLTGPRDRDGLNVRPVVRAQPPHSAEVADV